MSDLNDDISISSANEDDTILHLVIEQMGINEIVDFIDMNWHEQTSTAWTCELIFPSSIKNIPCKDQNILQFVESKDHKQTKKRNIECFKVHLDLEKFPSHQEYNSASSNNLTKDLSNCSISCGFNLVRMALACGKVMILKWLGLHVTGSGNSGVILDLWIILNTTFVAKILKMIKKIVLEKMVSTVNKKYGQKEL